MELTCDVCGKSFEGRADARYCSGRCRTIAYRKRATPDAPPRRRPPLTDSVDGAAWRLYKAAQALARLTEDDRFPRTKAKLGSSRQRVALTQDTVRSILSGWPAPSVTPDSNVTATLAIPQPPKRGPRLKHAQIISNVVLAASGLCIALDEIQTLDGSVNSEEAARLADDLGEALDSFERIQQLLRSVTVE